jgi:hypothetical protein
MIAIARGPAKAGHYRGGSNRGSSDVDVASRDACKDSGSVRLQPDPKDLCGLCAVRGPSSSSLPIGDSVNVDMRWTVSGHVSKWRKGG